MARATGDEPGGEVVYVDPEEGPAAVDALDRAAFDVEHVPDGRRVRERVADDPPDCIVSEQDLPNGSGLELLRDVRRRDGQTPFVLFTDSGDERLAADAIAAGVSDYVPRDPEEKQRLALVDAVRRVVAEPEPGFPGVSEELKDRAIDEAPVGITIADANRRDYPLIYANDAFEELTGYTEEEALGRNCDFLQGEASSEVAVAEMSRALSVGDPASVEIRNYTKGGEQFWNRVDIAPIHRGEELTHYVGFQLDITERVEAEREARRQAERATAERRKVEALLERLDGLVTDVTSRLLGADTREAVEAAVCERLVETDEYAVAWVGDADPPADSVTPSTWAGSERPASFAAPLEGEGPVARAMATGEMRVVGEDGDPALLSGYADAVGERVAAVAALPLTYGDVTYGVLAVALRAGSTLSELERRVLSAVGRSTAMALHTLTSQRLLTSDEVTELEFALSGVEPFFVGLSGKLNASFVHVGTVVRGDDASTLFFETDADPEAVADALGSRPEEASVQSVTDRDDWSVLEFTVAASPFVDLLLDRGGRITAMCASEGTGELAVEIPPEAQPRALVEAIEDRFPGADLRAYREHERPAETRQDVRARIDDRLTDRQETALRTAIVGGFFQWPRDSTGEELAETMDIGRSTFHQHLRAAQRKIFEELYA
jgi:PAS domain S-box-containing protein